jgi:hypothetical protein
MKLREKRNKKEANAEWEKAISEGRDPYAESLTKNAIAWTWVKAVDNWCGNWGPDKTCFLAYAVKQQDGLYSVVCCGNDDMACYIRNNTELAATVFIDLLHIRGTVSIQELEELGFDFE